MQRDCASVVVTLVGLLAVSLCAAGCGSSAAVPSRPAATAPSGSEQQPATTTAASAQNGESTASSEPAAPEQPEITLELGDAESFQKTLESLRGKVVLVDFWATWCPPCMKQFPHTVEFSEKYADEGLAVVSVSVDDPEMSEEQVRAFLQKQGAHFTNLISRHGGGTKTFDDFDITGGVPHYKLYDRSGAERHRFSSTPMESDTTEPIEQIEPLLQELLAEPGA